MSSKPAAVELDFLGLDRKNTTTTSLASSTSSKSQLRRLYDRQRSFREVQNAITKINPELLKASMATLCPHDPNTSNCNGEATTGWKRSISVPSTPKPGLRPAEAAPLTIFYNGTVAVFDLPQDKAETILKFVDDGWFKKPAAAAEDPKLSTTRSENDDYLMDDMSKRRMLQRNVSLQRFLEKRKERLTAMPIHYNSDGNQKKKDKNIFD